MNAKETELRRIMAIVVDCCSTLGSDYKSSMTINELTSKSRSENAVMSRCIFVTQAIVSGYSVSTVAFVLKRTRQAIRYLMKLAENLRRTSKAYRIAEKEASLLLKKKTLYYERNDIK